MTSMTSQLKLPEQARCIDFNTYYPGVFCVATFQYDEWYHGGNIYVGKVHTDRMIKESRSGERATNGDVQLAAQDATRSVVTPGIELLGKIDNKVAIRQCQWSEHYYDMIVTSNYDGSISICNLNLADGTADAMPPRGRLANVMVEKGQSINCISWNHLLPEFVVTGSSSSRLFLFNLRSLDQVHASFSEHTKAVNDVKWNNNNPDEFASVGSDGLLKIWDRRAPGASVNTLMDKQATKTGEPSPLRCCDWHKQEDWLIAVGNADDQLLMWDIRNTLQPLRRRYAHLGGVSCVKFDTSHVGRLASSGSKDNTVRIWDSSSDGIYLTQEHKVHRRGVTSLDWDIHESGIVTSCGLDNLLISKPIATMTQVKEYYREGQLITQKQAPSLSDLGTRSKL